MGAIAGSGSSDAESSNDGNQAASKSILSSPTSSQAQPNLAFSSASSGEGKTSGGSKNVWSLPGGSSRFLQSGQHGKRDGSNEAFSFVTAHSQQQSGGSADPDSSFNNTHGDFYPGGSDSEGDVSKDADSVPAELSHHGIGSSGSDGTLAQGLASRLVADVLSPAINGSTATPGMSDYGTPRLVLDTSNDALVETRHTGLDAHATPLARPYAINGSPGSAGHVDRLAIIREKNASRAAQQQQLQQQQQDFDASSGSSDFANLRHLSKSPQRADSGSSGGNLDGFGNVGVPSAGENSRGLFSRAGAVPDVHAPLGFHASSWNINAGGGPGFGRSGTPLLSLPGAAFDNNSNAPGRFGTLAGGLLSPSAATVSGNMPNNAAGTQAFSPIGSPILNQYPNSTHAPFPPSGMNQGPPRGLYAPQPQGALLVPSEHDTPFDAQLKQSPVFVEVVERLARLEGNLRDLQRQVGGISRSVNLIQDRSRGGSAGGFHRSQSPQINGSAGIVPRPDGLPLMSANEEIRNLSAQLSSLSSNVAQLFQSQQPGGANFGRGGAGSIIGERATSPLLPPSGSAGGSGFALNQQRMGAGIDPNTRLSPRPFQGPGGNRASWGAGPEGASMRKPSGPPRRDSSGVGFDGPSTSNGVDPNFVITKWDHLNLHQDLLRSILKYGLGPPNKIQQRALPFLLRGTDIIAQAPPTQERIASYVIPALQLVLTTLREPNIPSNSRGPIVLMICTTVDQATQAQRMVLGLGSPLGVRVHIAAAAGIDIAAEVNNVAQAVPHVVIGTPQKMSELFTQLVARGAIPANDVRLVILDEVDQLIARNLSDHVSSLLRVLPMPRAGGGSKTLMSPSVAGGKPNWDTLSSPNLGPSAGTIDRQTAIFSNTVPQDVLNFAQSIHLRESVRVLVRREHSTTLGAVNGTANGPNGSTSGGSAFGGPASTVGSGTFGAGNVQSMAYQSNGYHGGGSGPPQSALIPSNVLGSAPIVNVNNNPLSDPMLSALRGLRQYYLYVAVSGHNMNSSGGPSSALEMKLDVITDLLEDMEFGQAVIYTGAPGTTEAVTYKLSSKGIEAIALVSAHSCW